MSGYDPITDSKVVQPNGRFGRGTVPIIRSPYPWLWSKANMHTPPSTLTGKPPSLALI